jgi:hypothetical protein
MSAQSPQQGQPTFEEYKVIVEKYEKELELFWPRANFYVLVQAGLLSVVVAVLSAVAVLSKTSSTAGTDSKELLQASAPLFLPAVIGLCLVGLVLGWFWLIVLIGSYGWISVWRTSARKLDKEIRGSHELIGLRILPDPAPGAQLTLHNTCHYCSSPFGHWQGLGYLGLHISLTSGKRSGSLRSCVIPNGWLY